MQRYESCDIFQKVTHTQQLFMREKFKRLTDEVWALTNKLEPTRLENSAIEAKLERILFKIHDMDGIINEIIPQLESQIKEKQTTLKKMKKTWKASEQKLTETIQRKENKSRFVEQQAYSKSKSQECSCIDYKKQEEKLRSKLERANEQIAKEKQLILQLKQRIKILQDKNHDLIQDNKSQLEVIEKLLAQFEENQFHYNQKQKCADASRMMREDDDDDSELRKSSDDIQTDDQLEDMVIYESDQESSQNDEIVAAMEHRVEAQSKEEALSMEEVEKEEQKEGLEPKKKKFSWAKHTIWFLF